MRARVNECLAENACENYDEPGIVSNGGELEIVEVAKMGGMPDPMPFSKNGIANLMLVFK